MLRYNYKTTDKLFWTSDTHFSHKNIMQYCDRPFSSIEEMNEKLISNWNSVVDSDATVFHLGDFAFGTISQWEEVRSQLNGEIHPYFMLADFNDLLHSHRCKHFLKTLTIIRIVMKVMIAQYEMNLAVESRANFFPLNNRPESEVT